MFRRPRLARTHNFKGMGSSASRSILLCALFLAGLGLVQVYSSSYMLATERYGGGLFFFKKQALWTAIGFAGLFALSFLPWKISWRLGTALWLMAAGALALTLFSGIGVSGGGARRWLALPFGMRLQPSELLKVSAPFWLAYLWLLKRRWPFHQMFFWGLAGLSFGLPLLILLKQPDFGSAVLICALAFSMAFVMGMKWRHAAFSLSAFGGLFYYLIHSQKYRLFRLESFLDPWDDPAGKGFQVIQSMLGIHSGGLFGAGLGQGQAKLFFLPEAHTDFALAALAEEAGFIGLLILFSVYGFLIWTGMRLALEIQEGRGDAAGFQKILAFGLIMIFAIHVLVHGAVNLSLAPAKGLTLPFLSYGGSSLISVFLLFGWLLSLERHIRPAPRGA